MPHVTIPAYDQLLYPTLRAVIGLGGSATIEEIVTQVLEDEGFSDEPLAVLHKEGPGTEIGYRLS